MIPHMVSAEFLESLLNTIEEHSSQPIKVIIPAERYLRLRYLSHCARARLFEPRYKLRKCALRRIARRRQAAKKALHRSHLGLVREQEVKQ